MASKERMEVFRDNLKSQIERFGLNQRKVCGLLDIPEQTMSEWMRLNRYPRVDTIDRLARFFGCRSADLTEPKSKIEKRADYLVGMFMKLSDEKQMNVLAYTKGLLDDERTADL